MADLTTEYLARIIREESARSGADVGDVLNMVNAPGLQNVRHRVFYRVHSETGAAAPQIARLWGCDKGVVYDGIAEQRRAWERLEAHRDFCRTTSNPDGDLAAWQNLGRGGSQAA